MKMIDKLPDDFLIETELTLEQEKVLLEQINRFNLILDLGELENHIFKNDTGDIFLKEGTIIHGTSYNEITLKKIADTGILTGQAFGVPEDGETFYCADFHRVYKDMSMEEYSKNFTYNDGRCPFGTKMIGQKQLAFVVNVNDKNSKLLSYDCYRKGTKESDVTRGFVNEKALPLNESVGSSILYGVPSNCFSGIVLGDKLIVDKDKVNFIIETFPWCYICSRYGKIIYEPNIKLPNVFDYTELKRQKVMANIEKNICESEIQNLKKEITRSELKYNKLLLSIINCVPIEMAVNVLINMGWQGDFDSAKNYLNNIKDDSNKIR